ncbi:hypothetical protein [Dyadobacter sp. CY323]|uniref:hypothetical protein n=1 Tax=Dyadobacter sp. CY323 TaxID=2907302 RepID=UPI001F342E42|nr:hypothetical protein [Dyadobacter sp. CY323]MCE6992078.1 hypothetical protein [Dyadobacter sp. CY323]
MRAQKTNKAVTDAKAFWRSAPDQSRYPESRQPIGFKPTGQNLEEQEIPTSNRSHEMADVLSHQATFNSIVLQVATIYFEKRANNGYLDGLNRELLEKMDKIYVKYFDKII